MNLVRSRRLHLILILAGIISVLYYFSIYDPTAPFSLISPKMRQSEKPILTGYLVDDQNLTESIDNDLIYILSWTKVFGVEWTEESIQNCSLAPTARCRLVSDRSYLDRSAAVIFHSRDIVHTDLPAAKYRHQKYVFYSHESPVLTFAALQGAARNFFDWTMTYRTDSHIYCPYTYFEPIDSKGATKNFGSDLSSSNSPVIENVMVQIQNRTKSVVWIVSNCDTHSKRERYVHELKKYINVDIFGDCGRSCKESPVGCGPELLGQYKFYISFENAVCRGYISEKFGSRLASGLIPIVLRRQDYDRVVPAEALHSDPSPLIDQGDQSINRSQYIFIAADDFQNPKALADYLNFLDTHPKEYLKYFEWHNKWKISTETGERFCMCDLCSKLFQERQRRRHLLKSHNASAFEDDREETSSFDIHDWWNVNTCDRGMALKLLEPNLRIVGKR